MAISDIGCRTTQAFMAAVLLLVVASCSANRADKPEVQLLTGATIFDGTSAPAIEHGEILVRDGRIECVGSEGECPNPPGVDIVDVTGKYITPGLVDAHVHFFQTGFFDGRPDALDVTDTYPFPQVAAYQKLNPQRYYDAYLCSGITGVYDVGGMSWSIDFQKEAESNPDAPHVAAAGPLITPVSGAPFDLPSDKVLVPLETAEAGVTTVQYLSALGSTGIKLWQLRADSEEYMDKVRAVAEEAEKQGNKLIVHATTLSQAKAAVDAGAKLLVHSVSDREVDEEFLTAVKEQGTIYTPTLIVSSGYMLAYRAAAGIAPYQIDDPNGCVDAKTRQLMESAGQFSDHPAFTESFKQRLTSFDPQSDRVSQTDLANLKKVYDAGITIAVGTDAGNPGTLHGPSIYEEMEAMQRAGIPAEELIVMATRNGAIAMEREQDFGTLESGKIANLIVLEKDPSEDITNMRSLIRVMIKGKLMYAGEIVSD